MVDVVVKDGLAVEVKVGPTSSTLTPAFGWCQSTILGGWVVG